MKSLAVKRALFAVGLLAACLVLVAGWFVFEITRDPGVSWEAPTAVEDSEARRKIKLYEKSLAGAQQGFVRFSPSELNAFLTSITTNAQMSADAPLRLKRAAIDITRTNITYSALTERRIFNQPIDIIVQRGFHVVQRGTNHWDLPLDWIKIGHLEVPQKYWRKMTPIVKPIDEALAAHFKWATNIPAMLVTKNDLSQRPELRLYTFKPIPASDLK